MSQVSSSQYPEYNDYEWRFKPVHPAMQCPASGIATHLCANDNCQHQGIICNHPECVSCLKHKGCKKSSLEDITQLYNTRSEQLRQFNERYIQIENRLMEQLAFRRKRIYETAFKSGLDERYIEIIEALYYGRQDVLL